VEGGQVQLDAEELRTLATGPFVPQAA
jgi:hypothetical protein